MYGIYINNSNRNTQDNNEINDNFFGIYLNNSTNNQLSSNNFSGFGLFAKLDNGRGGIGGICLENSNDNKLMNNTILRYWEGVNLTNSSNNELNNNSILDNYFSLSLVNSNNNKVLNNTIVKLGYSYSVVLTDSQNNTLKGNTAGPNTGIKVIYNAFNSTNNTLEGEIHNADEPPEHIIPLKNKISDLGNV
jgi:parallel beta-helix repeat protein